MSVSKIICFKSWKMTGFEVTMKTIAGDGEEDMGCVFLNGVNNVVFLVLRMWVFGGFWVVKWMSCLQAAQSLFVLINGLGHVVLPFNLINISISEWLAWSVNKVFGCWINWSTLYIHKEKKYFQKPCPTWHPPFAIVNVLHHLCRYGWENRTRKQTERCVGTIGSFSQFFGPLPRIVIV